MRHTKQRKIKKYRGKKSRKGGAALGAGTAGCTFYPKLACSLSNPQYISYNDTVSSAEVNEEKFKRLNLSKLLYKSEGSEEMKIFKNIWPILSTIPNGKDYFIPNAESPFLGCNLSTMQKLENLDNFSKCTNIGDYYKDITPTEALEELRRKILKYDNLMLIQQEYGGDNFKDYIKKLKADNFDEIFSIINIKLIKLLDFGIRPMNDKGLLHLDIKPDNMVYLHINKETNEKLSQDSIKLRLIDWGFAMIVKKDDKIMDLHLLNNYRYDSKDESTILLTHTTMFNVPLSNILLNPSYIEYINKTYQDTKGNISHIINGLLEFEDIKYGHLEYIKSLIKIAYSNNSIIKRDPIKVWKLYIETILNNYIDIATQRFDANRYFKEIYVHNVDIYSLLINYLEILDQVIKLEVINKNLLNKLQKFIQEYLFGVIEKDSQYSCPIALIRYDIDLIIQELETFLEPALDLKGIDYILNLSKLNREKANKAKKSETTTLSNTERIKLLENTLDEQDYTRAENLIYTVEGQNELEKLKNDRYTLLTPKNRIGKILQIEELEDIVNPEDIKITLQSFKPSRLSRMVHYLTHRRAGKTKKKRTKKKSSKIKSK